MANLLKDTTLTGTVRAPAITNKSVFLGDLTSTAIATFLITPSSANLAAAVSDENGSGKLIFSAGTLAITSAKTLTVTNTLTIAGTDGSTLNIGAGGTLGTGAYAAAFNPAAPGPIGGTTPGSGSFTALSTTDNLTIIGSSSVSKMLVLSKPDAGGAFALEYRIESGQNRVGFTAGNWVFYFQYAAADGHSYTFVGTGDTTFNGRVLASGLVASKSVSFPYVEKTANYTITSADHTINVTANSPTITLPTSVGVMGVIYVIKNRGAGTVTLATTSSQNIDAATTATITSGQSLMVQSTGLSSGTSWIII